MLSTESSPSSGCGRRQQQRLQQNMVIRRDKDYNHSYDHGEDPCLIEAELELEELHQTYLKYPKRSRRENFPPDCLAIVRHMPGNDSCADCQGHDACMDTGVLCEPLWTSVAYGTLLCKRCALGHLERDGDKVGFFVALITLEGSSTHACCSFIITF